MLSFVMPKSFHEYCFLIFTAYMCLNIVISMIINGVSFHYFIFFNVFTFKFKAKNIWLGYCQKKNAITLGCKFLLLSVLIGLISRPLDPGALPITITMLLLPISVFIPFGAILNMDLLKQIHGLFGYNFMFISNYAESSRGAL